MTEKSSSHRLGNQYDGSTDDVGTAADGSPALAGIGPDAAFGPPSLFSLPAASDIDTLTLPAVASPNADPPWAAGADDGTMPVALSPPALAADTSPPATEVDPLPRRRRRPPPARREPRR